MRTSITQNDRIMQQIIAMIRHKLVHKEMSILFNIVVFLLIIMVCTQNERECMSVPKGKPIQTLDSRNKWTK